MRSEALAMHVEQQLLLVRAVTVGRHQGDDDDPDWVEVYLPQLAIEGDYPLLPLNGITTTEAGDGGGTFAGGVRFTPKQCMEQLPFRGHRTMLDWCSSNMGTSIRNVCQPPARADEITSVWNYDIDMHLLLKLVQATRVTQAQTLFYSCRSLLEGTAAREPGDPLPRLRAVKLTCAAVGLSMSPWTTYNMKSEADDLPLNVLLVPVHESGVCVLVLVLKYFCALAKYLIQSVLDDTRCMPASLALEDYIPTMVGLFTATAAFFSESLVAISSARPADSIVGSVRKLVRHFFDLISSSLCDHDVQDERNMMYRAVVREASHTLRVYSHGGGLSGEHVRRWVRAVWPDLSAMLYAEKASANEGACVMEEDEVDGYTGGTHRGNVNGEVSNRVCGAASKQLGYADVRCWIVAQCLDDVPQLRKHMLRVLSNVCDVQHSCSDQNIVLWQLFRRWSVIRQGTRTLPGCC